MRRSTVCAILSVSAAFGAATAAQAWFFDYRFVERVGNIDTPIGMSGAPYVGTPGVASRLRIQFGVFDDASGVAPAGGFIAWNLGTINAAGAAFNTRTPGRLPPFTFSNTGNDNGNPPLPGGDPFVALTDISATSGTQAFVWNNDGGGVPLPMPQPQIRGRNTFVSVFELTTTPGNTNYTITVGGNLVASSGWLVIGTPVPPDNNGTPLDPSDDIPGSVTYAPFPLAPQSFLLPPLVLDIQVPTPGAGMMVVAAGVVSSLTRRRRTV